MTNLRLPRQYDERLFALAGLGLQGPYYNWNRWYLPSVGRYMELDPIALEGGFNTEHGVDWYNYGGGNPLRQDPDRGKFRILRIPTEGSSRIPTQDPDRRIPTEGSSGSREDPEDPRIPIEGSSGSRADERNLSDSG